MRKGAWNSTTPERLHNSWMTPPEVFEPLHHRFNFEMDVCADEVNHVLNEYISEKKDALNPDTPWGNPKRWVWANPPYSNPLPWVERALERRRVVMLTNFDSTSKWAKRIFREANFVILLDWRISFVNPDDDSRGAANMYRQMLSIIGDKPDKHATILHMNLLDLCNMCGYNINDVWLRIPLKVRNKFRRDIPELENVLK